MSIDNDLLLVDDQTADQTGGENGNQVVDIGAAARIGAGEKITAQFKVSGLAASTDQLGIQIEVWSAPDAAESTRIIWADAGLLVVEASLGESPRIRSGLLLVSS